MFQTVEKKIQIIKDLLDVLGEIKALSPDTEWLSATFSTIKRLISEIVVELDNMVLRPINVLALDKFVEIIDIVSYLPFLTEKQETILLVKRIAIVQESILR